MAERPVGKRPPSHQTPALPLANSSYLPLNDLQTSTGYLREQIGSRKERDRIFEALREEREKNDHAGWISYDRLFRLIDEK